MMPTAWLSIVSDAVSRSIRFFLLSQAQFANQLFIAADIGALEIAQQATAIVDHHQKATP
jgi:hypothetical protein